MKSTVAIVTGISGVGKSWLLARVMSKQSGQLLSASSLISDELERRVDRNNHQDRLRERDIDDNQELLISGFMNVVDCTQELIVLDAHVVIDTPTGLQTVGAEIFSSLNSSLIVFVEGDPEQILQQRDKDNKRIRPQRDIETLRSQQTRAKLAASQIAEKLQIPLHIILSGDTASLQNTLESAVNIKSEKSLNV